MLIPHGSGDPRRIEIPVSLILVLMALWTGITFWGSYLSAQHVDYWRTQLTNQVLTMKVKYLIHQIDQSRSVLDEVKQVDIKLREMINASNPSKPEKVKSPKEYGTGGPTTDEGNDVSRLLDQADPDITWKRLVEKIGLLNSEANERISSYDAMLNWLDGQKKLFRATPTGWPCAGRLSSGFGRRLSPFTGTEKFHFGVDIANRIGAPLYATADGRIVISSWESGYGNLVVIQHDFGFQTRYAHCSRLKIKAGERVKRGQLIALMGATGNAVGSHCHYEVRQYDKLRNPFAFMMGDTLRPAPLSRLIKNQFAKNPS